MQLGVELRAGNSIATDRLIDHGANSAFVVDLVNQVSSSAFLDENGESLGDMGSTQCRPLAIAKGMRLGYKRAIRHLTISSYL